MVGREEKRRDGREEKERRQRTVVDARSVVILVVPGKATEDEADVDPRNGPRRRNIEKWSATRRKIEGRRVCSHIPEMFDLMSARNDKVSSEYS